MDTNENLIAGLLRNCYTDEFGEACEEITKICGCFYEKNGSVYFYGAEFCKTHICSIKLSKEEFERMVTNVCMVGI